MRFVALLLLGFLLQAPPALEPGFTALWNGKDFTGWRLSNPDSFSIQDGAIVAHGKAGPGHAFYDGPFRNHSFRSFELKVDVMTRAGSNGGVYMMTEFVESGWPAKGFEVQVNNTYLKDPIRTGSLYQVVNVKTPPAKDDVWFTEHIVVQGDKITVRVNDVETVDWTQPADWQGVRGTPGRRLGPGTIALQAHDPNSTVLYRNIRIKPLD
jgi:hypothetical protein